MFVLDRLFGVSKTIFSTDRRNNKLVNFALKVSRAYRNKRPCYATSMETITDGTVQAMQCSRDKIAGHVKHPRRYITIALKVNC